MDELSNLENLELLCQHSTSYSPTSTAGAAAGS